MAATAIVNRDWIIEEMGKGSTVYSVAQKLGVSVPAICQQLAKDEEYRRAREAGAQVRLDKQYEKMENAPDSLSLARARETFKAASWFAEREFPEKWGQKQAGANLAVQVVINPQTEEGTAQTVSVLKNSAGE